MMDGQKQPFVIVYVGIDFNKMLCLSQINNLKNWPCKVTFSEDVWHSLVLMTMENSLLSGAQRSQRR